MIDFKKAFIDTNPFIYFLERNEKYYTLTKNFFEKCYQKNKELVNSTVTVEEYCVFPYTNQDMDAIHNFEMFVEDMAIYTADITNTIAKKAAQIRSEYKYFKAMDALQLATAVVTGCDLFLTNDKQLIQFKEIKCITMDEL